MAYQLDGKAEEDDSWYKSRYQFDFYKAGNKRWLWVHKDECLVSFRFFIIIQFHGYTDTRAYTIPIMPICAGDTIELSVTLFSL